MILNNGIEIVDSPYMVPDMICVKEADCFRVIDLRRKPVITSFTIPLGNSIEVEFDYTNSPSAGWKP